MMPNKRYPFLAAGIAILLILAACSPQLPATQPGPTAGPSLPAPTAPAPSQPAPTQGAANPLSGTQWQLVSFGAAGTERPVLEGSTVTLTFNAVGQVGGNGGCNSFGGDYKVTGSRLEIGSLVSTLMACVDPKVTQQEQAYLKALQQASIYELSGDQLTLARADGSTALTFTRQTAATPDAAASLAGTRWALASMTEAGVENSLVAGSQVSLDFGPDGQASGKGGCNGYSAGYQTTGADGLVFDPPVSTEMACLDAQVTQQEQRYFAALGRVAAYQGSGDQLILLDADGQPLLTFTRAE